MFDSVDDTVLVKKVIVSVSAIACISSMSKCNISLVPTWAHSNSTTTLSGDISPYFRSSNLANQVQTVLQPT